MKQSKREDQSYRSSMLGFSVGVVGMILTLLINLILG